MGKRISGHVPAIVLILGIFALGGSDLSGCTKGREEKGNAAQNPGATEQSSQSTTSQSTPSQSTPSPAADTKPALAGPTPTTDAQTKTSSSGLKYVDLVVGTGASPKPGQVVTVHYTGWLTDGKKFDSSLDRGMPFQFPLGQGRVIKGWDEGVSTMKIGGKRKLIIPPDLAYGAKDVGNGLIPPNSTLVFEVELLGAQ
jgi:peptidylprolyl isomerase